MMGEQLSREIDGRPGVGVMPSQAKPRIDRRAVASFALGIVGYVPLAIASIAALAMGHAAYVRIRRSGGNLRGRRIAVAGAFFGWLGTAWSAWAWSGGFTSVVSTALFSVIWIGELVVARMVFISLRPKSDTPDGAPRRSSLALVGFLLTSLATAMTIPATVYLVLGGNLDQVVCVGNYFSPNFSCSVPIPRWESGSAGLSVLVGSVAFGILLFARREIRRSVGTLRGVWLVRFGFVLAIVGMLSVAFLALVQVGASLNTM